jgi:peptide/nickel transport system substrate-binding protein
MIDSGPERVCWAPIVMSLRMWAGAITAAALAVPAGACAGRRDPPPPGVLRVAEEQGTSFVRNFNPLNYAGDVRWPARHAMYEPLFIYNPLAGALTPWLATGYRWSDDGLRLELAIRHGVRWSDGVPLTARDVAFTLELLARHRELDAHGLWRHTRSVVAVDDATVQLSLARRRVQVLEALAEQPIVPEHVWSTLPDPVAFPNEAPVATGPFVRVSAFDAQSYQVERNPDYWQPGVPAVQALRFRAYGGNEQTLLALLGDELDWAGELVPAVERIYVRRDPAHHRYWFPLLDATIFLYANTRRPPLDLAPVRKALSLAIDRDRLVKVAMHGYTRPADGTGLNDAHARFRDPAAVARGDWVAFDPPRAARLLDEAGCRLDAQGRRRGPDGTPLSLPISVPAGYSDWVAAAQIIARGLRRLGIESPVVTSEFQAWFERLQQGDFALLVGRSEVSATPYGFYRALMSTESVRPLGEPAPENWHRFGLRDADALLARLEETTDPAEERSAAVGLELLFAEHAPAIPLFSGPLWGEFNGARFTGFPDAEHPYAPLAPYLEPQSLLVLTRLAPR